MILHIVVDDKFIDMAYNMFERVNQNNNEFMVVTNQKVFKYIKTTPITKVSPLEFLTKSFANSLLKYEFVVLHWLDDMKIQLLLNAPKNVKFVWIGWGGDYYNFINKPLYLPQTQNLINNSNQEINEISFKQKIKNFIKQKFFLKKIENIESIINRINYFAPVLEEDYELLSKSFSSFTPKYMDWNYGSLEDDILKNQQWIITGEDILVGNSATAENNHLDTFEILKSIDLHNRKIICPLSYGDPIYGKYISKSGQHIFGDDFVPLMDFMPIDKYNQIISNCSIAIMNHLRQQAVGNIIAMMYFGAKVFLNKDNPVYWFFKKNGAIVFTMEELSIESISVSLSMEEVETNRNIIKQYWSRNIMMEKTKRLIETVKSDSNA
jgi:hypothetical protein